MKRFKAGALVAMQDCLGSTVAHDYEAPARIIVSLAHARDLIARFRNHRVYALTGAVALGREINKAFAVALR